MLTGPDFTVFMDWKIALDGLFGAKGLGGIKGAVRVNFGSI